MNFRTTLTDIEVLKSGNLILKIALEVELVADSGTYKAVYGWPGKIDIPISVVKEIVNDDVTWPTKSDKLIEFRDRVKNHISVHQAVLRTLRLGTLLNALPDLPYETIFDIT